RRCAIDGSRHQTSIGAIDLNGHMVRSRVLLESRSASIELKDADVQRCHRGYPAALWPWRSGDRATRLKYSQNASRRVAPGGISRGSTRMPSPFTISHSRVVRSNVLARIFAIVSACLNVS